MTPSPYWYLTRGLGAACLVFLTVAVVLGIGTWRRWGGRTPVFMLAAIHRSASLIAVLLVVAHVVTTVLDPFAHISVRDALVPFGASYRPVWLGLGVASTEVLAAVVVTSLLRTRIGPAGWKLVHWGAYAAWPLAAFHGLGTGSDARAPWFIGLVAACTTAVLLAVGERLTSGSLRTVPVRLAAGAAACLVLYGGTVWAIQGPFAADWASRSGTPAALLARAPAPVVHHGPFSDPLVGVLARSGGYTQLALRDSADPALTIAVRSPDARETLPVVTVQRSGRTVCVAPATATQTLYAVCGGTRLQIALYGSGSYLQGRLTASGPLK